MDYFAVKNWHVVKYGFSTSGLLSSNKYGYTLKRRLEKERFVKRENVSTCKYMKMDYFAVKNWHGVKYGFSTYRLLFSNKLCPQSGLNN